MHHPEFLECGAQAQADLPALCRLFVCHLLQRPLQGFAQIVVLLFQSLQQERLLWAHHSLLCFLCQSQEVCSMSPSRYLRFPTSSQALQRILTNRLQHGKPWLLACLLLHALEQAFVGEGSFCFFFSSRRRHTRWTGDWSSDVCSSDLSKISRSGRKVMLVPRRSVFG